jgi:Xaa-Pro aminopeptidase
MSEIQAAALLRSGLISTGRCDGFAYCMSGPNAAQAYAAYQRSTTRKFEKGDFVLLHCNSYCAGFWTDITRTFVMGAANAQQEQIYDAVLRAGQTAFSAVRPGARASAVDTAARDVMAAHGLGKEFKHATGHGVGFAAINHNARPRIHPASNEILEPGMIFNIEPAVYLDGQGGNRQCNMALVTASGAECLTPFLNESTQLQV